MRMGTALMTDRYELTMVDAALTSGTHERESVFEVFARSLPGGRRFGVVAGTGRLLELIRDFRFDHAELAWLDDGQVVSRRALDLLASYRFTGRISGYPEGEVYLPGSPLFTVQAPFWEAVVLETLALSVLNHDSAIATAAARMVSAAEGRPLAEMGSRRSAEHSAIAAARAAFIAGFGSTSNLEAGRLWGVPTMGTAAHAFTLLHDTEADAFRAQVATLGAGTTLLVDTYDIETAVRTAVEVAGPELGAVRIDSGDLPVVVRRVREQLDALGATTTRITVTNDLDEYAIAGLAAAPVDSYGVGTRLVTGSGQPTAGLVYKLVARRGSDGDWVSVAKTSSGKAGSGGAKHGIRQLGPDGVARRELVVAARDPQHREPDSGTRHRLVTVPLMEAGDLIPADALGAAGVLAARERCAAAIAELPLEAHRLTAGEPVIPTERRTEH